jgi:hypothetical protein
MYRLSLELFDRALELPNFPVRKTVRGIGMSDWDGYAADRYENFGVLWPTDFDVPIVARA